MQDRVEGDKWAGAEGRPGLSVALRLLSVIKEVGKVLVGVSALALRKEVIEENFIGGCGGKTTVNRQQTHTRKTRVETVGLVPVTASVSVI